MSERVLVTGATGFIGGLLVERLLADRRPLRALVLEQPERERLAAERLAARGVETAVGSLEDEESLVRAADGCAVVYHLAGINQLCLPDPTPLYRVNVDGTRNMLAAARRAGVRRVVYTSSAAVFDGDGSRFLDETAPWPEPATLTSHYARSKLQAEKLATGFDGVEVVLVNPASVQGPGRTTGTAKMFIDYLSGKLPFDIPARFGLCYTEDCVNGHLLAEVKGEPGQRYILNTATMTGSEAIAMVADIAGLTDRPRTLPVPLAMAAATVLEGVARSRGRVPGNCRESIRTLAHPHLYDGSRAERDLGLRYTPLRAALEATVRWYVTQGLIERPLPNLTA